jgi:hypothetical protein
LNNQIKLIIFRTIFYDSLRAVKNILAFLCWVVRKKPDPPPALIKQLIIKEHCKKYRLKKFIETGTYLGDMVYSARNLFREIITIEIDKKLFDMAKYRLRKYRNITVELGDSTTVLKRLLQSVQEPCLFWLDAHFSGGITSMGKSETPIFQELEIILNHGISGHVVLIDDARCFTGKKGYPTIKDLSAAIATQKPSWNISIICDVIRAYGIKECVNSCEINGSLIDRNLGGINGCKVTSDITHLMPLGILKIRKTIIYP